MALIVVYVPYSSYVCHILVVDVPYSCDSYDGEYVAGRKEGAGMFRSANGDTYEGIGPWV